MTYSFNCLNNILLVKKKLSLAKILNEYYFVKPPFIEITVFWVCLCQFYILLDGHIF